jgi:hypothetical protein
MRLAMKIAEIGIASIPWALIFWNATLWEEYSGQLWAESLIPLILFATLSMEYFKNHTIPDFKYDEDNCTCYGIEPNGKQTSLLVRLLSVIFIIVQIGIFLDDGNGWDGIVSNLQSNGTTTVLPSDFSKFTTWASFASMLYILSGLILIATLCQCGRNKDKQDKSELLRWGLHDVVLGSIWLALTLQFHDVVDDYDDKHWRHLFSSMIVFHVIILLFDIMSNPKYQIDYEDERVALWSEATKPAIKESLRFILYSVIYWCILSRLHDDSTLLVNMGIDNISLHAIWVSSIGLIVLNVSEFNTDSNQPPVVPSIKGDNKGKRLQVNRSLLSF